MLYELRQYRIKRGRMKEWVKVMETHIIPFQVASGMVIAGSFTAVDDANLYVWLRRFRNEADRKRLYAKVYESEQWKKVISPMIDPLLDRASIVVTKLAPTAASVLQ